MLKAAYTENLVEAGCDEVGRGCLAGPVVAAAVILPKDYINHRLMDSKALSAKMRTVLRNEIIEEALAFATGLATREEIDRINILNASFLAMHRAIKKLSPMPEFLLIDGNRFASYESIRHKCIVKGDGKYMSIAAASILAKTFRDDLMRGLSNDFPQYGWDRNMGYPTGHHRNAIKEYGFTEHHRRSFRLLPSQLDLFANEIM